MLRDAFLTLPVGAGPVLRTQQQPAGEPAASPRLHLGDMLRQPQGSPAMLTVTDVRQYFYCPRIVFYRLCQPLRRPTTYKMREGKLAQDRTADLEHERSLRAYGLEEGERHFNVSLRSESLGLQGIIDMVIVTADEAIPVEFKNTTRPPARNHTYQLAAYALLVEERWGLRVRRGFVYRMPLKDATELRLTPSHRSSVRSALTAMRQMVAREQQPEPTERVERCRECEYRCFCGDVD
jgi:CRISPR-associated exonuclease Cas4